MRSHPIALLPPIFIEIESSLIRLDLIAFLPSIYKHNEFHDDMRAHPIALSPPIFIEIESSLIRLDLIAFLPSITSIMGSMMK